MQSKLSTCVTIWLTIQMCYINAQDIISTSLIKNYTKQELSATFALPLISFSYGARAYKVRYTSPDAKGNKDTLSGLMVVPDNLNFQFPRAVYQHGTSNCKTCVPSRLGTSDGSEGQLGLLMAGLGFVALLPDYVGMGDGRGFQTYVHASTIASAGRNLVSACEQWAASNGLKLNDQLFITGYSQGGYGSMALHKNYEEFQSSQKVTAATHLSGPYSLSGVMRNLILDEAPYNYPAYIPNTIMGFNEAYGTLYKDLSDIFKPEYVPEIKKYYDGNTTLSAMNINLVQLLTAHTGASVGGRMIKDSILNLIKTDPNHPANVILRENDLFRWAPKSPTRILYCMADDQVPFQNSIIARDSMLARGATDLIATDVGPTLNHGGCVSPALAQTLFFFLSFQRVIASSEQTIQEKNIQVYPNPTSDQIILKGLNAGYENIRIYDGVGRQVSGIDNNTYNEVQIDMSNQKPGMYYLIIQAPNGKIDVQKIIKI